MDVVDCIPEHHLRGCRIMVIEDEFFAAEGLANFVLARGATLIGPFPNLEKAFMGWGESDPVHVALLDVKLRDQVVYSLADVLIARRVEIIFITGYERSLLPGRYSAHRHLHKPVDFSALDAALFSLGSGWRKMPRTAHRSP